MPTRRTLLRATLATPFLVLAAAAVALAADEWGVFDPAADTTCADGSDPVFHERRADPARVVLYFEGGGGCFSASTCAFDGPDKAYVSSGADVSDFLEGRGGIFDFDDLRNPVAEHSFVYVPYCTGDVHLGTNTHAYADDLVVEHQGYHNATAGLRHLVEAYPDATEVIVTGSSAGGIPTPLFGALVADELPDARVVTLADSSGAYPDVPVVNAFIGALWGTEGAIPDWPEAADIRADEWSIPGLYVRAHEHAPEVTYGRFDYAFDDAQAFYADLAGVERGDLISLIEDNEAQAEAAGAEIVNYLAPGDDHTIIGSDEFYELEVEGVRFSDWFTDLVSGATPADVRCADCGGPAR
jgi:hypothetical protein